jgi:long-subunit acyl-CoA synthetase (AMP-forming)/GNAT superfamily N-acetyltransferase
MMKPAAGAEPETLETRIAALRGLASLDGAAAAACVADALDHAGRPETSTADALRLDQSALGALRDALNVDAVLSNLDAGALGGLLERYTRRLKDDTSGEPGPRLRRAAWDVLDLVRRSAFLRRIEPARVNDWAHRILAAVEASHLTVGPLFRQRAALYGSKVLFQLPQRRETRNLTWRRVAARTEQVARGLLSLEENPAPVAILSDNRLEMALADLACLTSGLVNVMVPANSTESEVAYILRHSRVRTVLVSDTRQLAKVQAARDGLPDLQQIVIFDPRSERRDGLLRWESLLARSERVPASEPQRRSEAVRVDDLATVMYTSGTTGTPKAIQFSHRNLVFKRFARGLALPEIGEQDVLLCFLPLFHTFGRFLELLGCVYWGATYCFLDNPSVEALVRGMKRHRPTVFISVPKKWIQLHETITQKADPLSATDDQLLEATRQTTGGRLRWGLSAAGHLDSDVFRFFQNQGVELLSGFGMTEATGGITMTRAGVYLDDSLGQALPGIELQLAEDGELLIRGPYVMTGYLDPPDGQPSFDDAGWFHSGDLMERSPEGHYRLVDRKKEIYKNIKGETIAPQRIENLFRELESVGRAFLVGDHRDYNTLLVYPNRKYEELDLSSMTHQEITDHFRSLVVSVNKFLAPYERIVDFSVIDRDLDADRGELTPKNTPRRKTVVRNFADTIQLLYRQADLHVGGIELTVPNWLFQSLGITAQDITIGDERIMLPATGRSLTVRRRDDEVTQIGSCWYRHPAGPLNLGALLSSSRLWLGNEELVEFAALELEDRERPGRAERGVEWIGRPAAYAQTETDVAALQAANRRSAWDLLDLDRAARLLAGTDESGALEAVRLIERILAEEEAPLAEPARLVLARSADAASSAVQRRAFQVLVPTERDVRFADTLRRFLSRPELVLDQSTRAVLSDRGLPDAKFEAFISVTLDICTGEREPDERSFSLLDFLAEYGAAHPVRYRRLRAVLVRLNLLSSRAEIRARAEQAVEALRQGYRQWLGPPSRIAVDPETGQEYRWEDVVVFDDSVEERDRQRLLSAIKETALLREAAFLFAKGIIVRLSDVPPGGVWVRLLGSRHGKSVYRITIQTRFQGAYDVAVNVNHSLTPEQVREEIHWLIVSGDFGQRDPLVEDFGGYWAEQNLWSEEFIAGETLARALRRLSRRKDDAERLRQLWPFLAWTALSGYVDFWHRSGKRWEIADPGMTNVVVPTDDYHSGVRIVSVSARRPHRGTLGMIRRLRDEFIRPAEQLYPVLEGVVGWDTVFSSILEITGEDDGLTLLLQVRDQDSAELPPDLRRALDKYVSAVQVRGFLPRRLFFAAKRYRRWEKLSGEATPPARARTLQEFYDTYNLARLARDYPEARVRFFRETVFRTSPPALAEGLEEIIANLREGELVGDELIDAVAELRAKLDLGPDDDYFLARLSLPYLRPEDDADFVSGRLGGEPQSEIVVTLEDQDGIPFRVRHALNPKEVERLHRLFLAAKLDVRFRPDHRYLVAINDRSQLVAGIYYEIEEDGLSAHLEKIVVADPYRRKGVADGVMKEFFNRLRAAGVKTVTTGFFRPEYFYSYGFRIEKRYAGLVKSLQDPPENNGS